ncbi:hypothetical protein EBME_0194 [bacterium endosymbiont of Mortierella elongata FMR23-6]|nr:hypothetical protein EBME_0194 [bacterium endosymbiont of Mortierella elongata FMR23-6]
MSPGSHDLLKSVGWKLREILQHCHVLLHTRNVCRNILRDHCALLADARQQFKVVHHLR